jgi:hypothetical protein
MSKAYLLQKIRFLKKQQTCHFYGKENRMWNLFSKLIIRYLSSSWEKVMHIKNRRDGISKWLLYLVP